MEAQHFGGQRSIDITDEVGCDCRVVAFELESSSLSHIADAAARDGQFIEGGGDMRSERRLLVAPRRSFRRRAAGLLMELLVAGRGVTLGAAAHVCYFMSFDCVV